MNIFIGLLLAAVRIPQILAVCSPNTVCENERDTIIQLNATVLAGEKMLNRGRSWYIQPQKKPFNAILAFKNFSSMSASVMVIAYTGPKEKTIKYFYGNLSDFEVVSQNVVGLIIYVPINRRDNADFVLNYYTDCEILSSASDQISSISARLSSEEQTTCWFIQPSDNRKRRRVYFSARDVFLNHGQQLAIWDIHTMTVIAKAQNGDEYELIAAETDEHQSILIDLVCTVDYCNKKFNSYFISYYAMTNEDIACIQKQKQCDENDNLPFEECDTTCPAFDNMIIEEYGLRLQETRPRFRSAMIDGPVIDDNSVNGPPVEEETDETENPILEGQSVETTTAPEEEMVATTRPRRRRRRCPLPRAYCRCNDTVDKSAFCSPNVFCLGLGRCTFACIFHKLTTCIEIKILSSIKLL